ncbi:M20 family metallopeptidase [Natronincola ferrireducens]|uniref:Probable succinyl-diaminopimelate desuccinylase n=1 Tax=Natronincola ferrireducens TaxID=393762 RepID=A0A1G9FE35_9FIRM|nr:M20 family metallopeptidase [Natronincola ferrireducens]SDK86695.1 succinyl-diaminopimelate desuccinylase [Natronincola ferrireducens]
MTENLIGNSYLNVVNMVNEEELISFTQQLLRINSVYDPKKEGCNEERVAYFVADYLKKMGLDVYIDEVVPGRPNVIAILQGAEEGKTLLFEGHTDVVTAGDLDEWNYPPFDGVIDNGNIYGRGACDTKGNLAAAIFAVKAIINSGQKFFGKILLCIPVDEEGMMLGIKDFIKKGWADEVDAAVICEPQENNICITQKGAMRIILRVEGKMAHGAMPLAGINPNWGMAKVICELEKLQQKEINRLGKHPYLGYPSITPTILMAPSKGEAQINVIPKECYTTLDIRTVPEQNHEILKKEIQEIIDRLAEENKDFKASMEVIEERPWTETPKEEHVVQAISNAYTILTGKEPIYNGVPGATDGTFLNCLKGIPIVTTGAGDRLIPHQADEYVEIKELVETTKIYALTALLYLNDEEDI